MKKIPKSQLVGSQEGLARSIEQWSSPADKAKLEHALQQTKYKGNKDELLKDLKAGKLSQSDLEDLYKKLGIDQFAPEEAGAVKDIKDVGKVAATKAEEGSLIKKLKENKNLTPKEQHDLKDIEQHLKDPKKADQARADLEKLKNKANAFDDAANITKDKVHLNTHVATPQEKITVKDAENLQNELTEQINQLTKDDKSEPALKAAKDKILQTASEELNKLEPKKKEEMKKAIDELANKGLFAEMPSLNLSPAPAGAAAKPDPAKGSTPVAKPAVPPPVPPSGKPIGPPSPPKK